MCDMFSCFLGMKHQSCFAFIDVTLKLRLYTAITMIRTEWKPMSISMDHYILATSILVCRTGR